MAKNPAIIKTRVEILEDGTRRYHKMCPRCRKMFIAMTPQQVYCSDACKEAYNKAKKSKSRSGKRYVRKHNVSRAVEAAGRNLSRRLMMLVFEPVDAITGEKFNSWDYLQCHHLNLCPQDCQLSNLLPLTPQSHADLHVKIKEKFGKDIEDKLYEFGKSRWNYSSEEEYEKFVKLRDEVVKFELSMCKGFYNQSMPVFNTQE